MNDQTETSWELGGLLVISLAILLPIGCFVMGTVEIMRYLNDGCSELPVNKVDIITCGWEALLIGPGYIVFGSLISVLLLRGYWRAKRENGAH